MNNKLVTCIVIAIIVVAAVGYVLLSTGNDDGRDEFDGTLEIYGNINGDMSVDDEDLELLNDYLDAVAAGEDTDGIRIITEWSDVNRDGTIDSNDMEYLENILNRVEGTVLYMLDGDGEEKGITIRDTYRIASDYTTNAELVNILGVVDMVVAVDQAIYTMRDFYMANHPDRDNLVNFGNQSSSQVDIESVAEVGANLWLCQTNSYTDVKAKAVDDEAIYLGLTRTLSGKPSESVCGQAILKAGYIFNNVERAEDYLAWLDNIYTTIYDVTKDIPDEDRPSVILTYYGHYMLDQTTQTIYAYTDSYLDSQAAELAGAKNIIMDHTDDFVSSINLSLESMIEWEDDIDFVLIRTVYIIGSGEYAEGTPINGYTVDDSTMMDEAPAYLNSLPLLSGIDEDKFKLLSGYFFNSASCGMLCAVYYSQLFFPELFEDLIDVDAIHQEYVSDWLGIDLDLSQHGVFSNF